MADRIADPLQQQGLYRDSTHRTSESQKAEQATGYNIPQLASKDGSLKRVICATFLVMVATTIAEPTCPNAIAVAEQVRGQARAECLNGEYELRFDPPFMNVGFPAPRKDTLVSEAQEEILRPRLATDRNGAISGSMLVILGDTGGERPLHGRLLGSRVILRVDSPMFGKLPGESGSSFTLRGTLARDCSVSGIVTGSRGTRFTMKPMVASRVSAGAAVSDHPGMLVPDLAQAWAEVEPGGRGAIAAPRSGKSWWRWTFIRIGTRVKATVRELPFSRGAGSAVLEGSFVGERLALAGNAYGPGADDSPVATSVSYNLRWQSAKGRFEGHRTYGTAAPEPTALAPLKQ